MNAYLARFAASGLAWPVPPEVSPADLEARLFTRPVLPPAAARPLPDWPTVRQELTRKGVTLQLLWTEYKTQHPDGYQYTQFCRHYHAWAATIEPVLRQVHVAGERTFVDYAGPTVPVLDGDTGEERDAQIFVAALGASNSSDPFGLCPPDDKDDGPQCRVKFAGVALAAVVGSGVTGTVGFTYSKDEGVGVFMSGGAQAGLDLSISGEGGVSQNRAAFEGGSLEGCAGALGVGACVATNTAGLTGSGSLGVGTKDLPIPLSVRAGGTQTRSYTWKDLKQAGGRLVARLEENLRIWSGAPR